uniref:Uncharacterized protein n=1 Tax=Leptobrachium leishanense TaxID=445787 RepID=A0A8C5Q479_9ANUR
MMENYQSLSSLGRVAVTPPFICVMEQGQEPCRSDHRPTGEMERATGKPVSDGERMSPILNPEGEQAAELDASTSLNWFNNSTTDEPTTGTSFEEQETISDPLITRVTIKIEGESDTESVSQLPSPSCQSSYSENEPKLYPGYEPQRALPPQSQKGGRAHARYTVGRSFSYPSLCIRRRRVTQVSRSFPCSYCGKCFANNSHLVRHQRIHTGEKPYACAVCGKCFSRSSHVDRHHLIHAREKPHLCPVCGMFFSRSSHLAKHMSTHKGPNPFSCSVCDKRFSCRSLLFRHRVIHKKEKSPPSSESQHSELDSQQNLQTQDKPSRSFESGTELPDHAALTERHEANADKTSSPCEPGENNASTATLSTNPQPPPSSVTPTHIPGVRRLVRHKKNNPRKNQQLFTCSECGKTSGSISSLIRHERTHTGERPYSCPECEKCFADVSTLNKHLLTHTGIKPFLCPECGRRFRRKAHLIRHLRTHTGERPFLCSECGKSFSSKCHLDKHHKIHTRLKHFPCTECGKTFRFSGHLERHLLTHTGGLPYACTECGKCFIRQSTFIKHQRKHAEEQPFPNSDCGGNFTQDASLGERRGIPIIKEESLSCSESGDYVSTDPGLDGQEDLDTDRKPFSSLAFRSVSGENSTLLNHEASNHVEKPFSCSEPGTDFTSDSDPATDHQNHTGEVPFSLPHLPLFEPPLDDSDVKPFSEYTTFVISDASIAAYQNLCMAKSRSSASGESSENAAGIGRQTFPETEKLYSCSECQRAFRFKSALVRHQRIHTGEKPFQCFDCGKCFTDSSTLGKHLKTHTGEKTVECPDCGRFFAERSTLVKHMRTHTGEKPFECFECGKCFSRNAHLGRHLTIHTGEKPFLCPDCGKHFADNSTLVKHRRVHTGEKPFTCTECGKCFKENAALTKHQRVHTGEKPYYCLECGRRFARNSHLARHRQSHAK